MIGAQVEMRDAVHRAELARLAERRGRCVSLFMPTHRVGSREDVIRFRNLLSLAEKLLREDGMRGSEAKRFLRPLHDLLEDHGFWRHQQEGLAIFTGVDWARVYRVPLSLDELVVVGEYPHVDDLEPLAAIDIHFYLLALDLNGTRLYLVNGQDVTELPIPEAPLTLGEFLAFDDPEKQLTFHVAGRGGPGARTIRHGHELLKEDRKGEIARFMHELDRGVRRAVAGHAAPLVLAGVRYETDLYRAASRYRNIVPGSVEGSSAHARQDELADRARAKLTG